MADFFKGLAGGFGTGLQFGQAMRERNMRDELAQAYARPQEFVDYTPEQTREIQRLQGTGAYDVTAVPGAEGAVPTLRYAPRQGLDLQGDMPAAPMEIAPQRVQRFGGQTVAGQFDPTQLRGLQMQEAARVLGSYGDVRGAAALQAQAEEQAYQARIRPLQLQQLQGSIAGQEQQRELTGIQLGGAKRTEAELQRASEFAAFAAENPNATTQELKDAAFKQFKFTPKQWQDAVNTRLGIKEGEQKDFVLNVKNKLKGKNLNQLGELYNTDPDFDDKTDLAIVPGKGGAVTLNFVDKATGRVTSSQSFRNEALATEYLNKQATEPETIGSWMMALRKGESAMDAQAAAIRASDAAVGLRNQQMQMLRTQAAGNAEAQKIRADYEALTPEEQTGPAGQGLIRQFNMANAKAGTPIPLGTTPRGERTTLSPADVTARAKALVESRTPSISNPKKPMTMTEAISYVEGGMRNPIAERLDAALGGGGDPFAPPAAGGGAPQQTRGLTQPAAAPAPARSAPVEPNPYVDARGRPLAVAPAGSPSLASTAIPAAASAVEGAVGTQAAATRYLQAKIARNEPLSPTERARAQQMGLIR
jgi:hypothetical protein